MRFSFTGRLPSFGQLFAGVPFRHRAGCVEKDQPEQPAHGRGDQFRVIDSGIVPQILPVIIGTIILDRGINVPAEAGLFFFRQMAMFNHGGVALIVLAILIAIGATVSRCAREAVILAAPLSAGR
jgi:hypothetical protein